MRQSHQAKLRDQPARGIPAPPRLPPALGQKRIEPVLDPPSAPREEPSHIRLAVEVPPPPHHRVDPLDHFPKLQGCLPSREGSNLLLKPLHRLLPRDGIQVLRVDQAAALGGRQAMPRTLLHLVPQALEALADM